MEKVPQRPLMNRRGYLSTALPAPGSKLVTFGYPENATMDFNRRNESPRLIADYYEGEVIEHVASGPCMPYPHFTTTIRMPHGTSGGPVFCNGQIVGVNCRAWDFGAGEFADDPLSSVVPMIHALRIQLPLSQLPQVSWEYEQLPAERRHESFFTFDELATFGHIQLHREIE